jgi:hypothetical protein
MDDEASLDGVPIIESGVTWLVRPYAVKRFRRTSAERYRILGRRYRACLWAAFLRRHGMSDQKCPNLVSWKATRAEHPAVIRAAVVGRKGGWMLVTGLKQYPKTFGGTSGFAFRHRSAVARHLTISCPHERATTASVVRSNGQDL